MAELPERAPRRWFVSFTYQAGLHIEKSADDEADALQTAFAHLSLGAAGSVRIGYRSFRSRVIAYGEDELWQMMRQIT